MSSNKTEFKTEAPSLYKRAKGAEGDQTPAPVVNKEKRTNTQRPKTTEGKQKTPRVNRNVHPSTSHRTLYIGKVYYDELDKDVNRSQQLNQERMKLLKEVFQRFGEVERFEPHLNESFVHVCYKDRKFAQDAIDNLGQRSNRDEIMEEIKEKLRKAKLPESVCPVLFKYRYEWSNKSAESPSETRPKTAVAKVEKKETPVVTSPVNGTTSAEPKKEKKKRNKKEQTEETTAPVVEVKAKETKEKKVPVQDLQLEAERARLTQDLEYLRQQHKSVSKELSSERDRCASREERIKRLQEEHGRVSQHALQIENQLKTDLSWKQAAEERTSKLQEEINHLQQQQLLVSSMLQTVAEL